MKYIIVIVFNANVLEGKLSKQLGMLEVGEIYYNMHINTFNNKIRFNKI